MASSSSAVGAPNTSSLQQLREYAITFSGYGVKHGVDKRRKHQYIQTNSVSSITVEKGQNELIGFLNRIETEPLDSVPISELERTRASAPIIEADKETNKAMPVGTNIPISPEGSDHSPVFRVVVKVVEEMPEEGAKLYVLLEEKDGLSVPYRVAQNKAFFFDEF